MTPDELELIENAQNGDVRSFEELVYRYDSKVMNLALRFLGDEDTAKDIYQEVFIRAYRGIKNFKFKSEFSTWIYRITANACLTYKSRDRSRLHVAVGTDDEQYGAVNIIDTANSPEAIIAGNELSDLIRTAVDSLSPKQKMTFILKHFEGYKIREIAEMMSCNEGTIKKYLFDATRNLRNTLSFINS